MKTVPILMYHSVSSQADGRYGRWCVSPGTFRQHMSILADGNYTVLTVGDLVARMKSRLALPDRCVALTFDDGLRDFVTDAAPILKQFGFPATLYVVAGLVGQTSVWLKELGEGSRPMLRQEDLGSLVDQGVEIGAHSMTHPALDILSPAEATFEIERSRSELERMISAPVRSFAYPHGYASRTTKRIVRSAGFSSAVRVRDAFSAVGEDLFGLSRLIITEKHQPVAFTSLLEGQGAPIAPRQERLAGYCWRAVRRIRKRWSKGGAGKGTLAVLRGDGW